MSKTDFLELDEKRNAWIFTGNELTAMLPERFKTYGCLNIGEDVMTLGVFDMVVDGEPHVWFCPARIMMEPTAIDTVRIGGDVYYEAVFHKGDKFSDAEPVEDGMLAYATFRELLHLGRMPENIEYGDIPRMFDLMMEYNGIDFGVDRVMFEIISAYGTRSKRTPEKQHRHDLNGEWYWASLNDVSLMAQSTMSKLMGAEFDVSTNAAIVNPATESSGYEQVVRK